MGWRLSSPGVAIAAANANWEATTDGNLSGSDAQTLKLEDGESYVICNLHADNAVWIGWGATAEDAEASSDPSDPGSRSIAPGKELFVCVTSQMPYLGATPATGSSSVRVLHVLSP